MLGENGSRGTNALALRALGPVLALLLPACLKPAPGTDTAAELRRRLEAETRESFDARVPSGITHELELVAAPTRLPLLDGRGLDVWAYNGQVPGPTIRVRVGDRLRVTLRNELPQPTSIHWHGVRLPNAMDGVPGVTQPPVAPGERFTYDFVVPDAGTFWFHPHVRGSEQVERGLHGVLVVEPRDDRPRPREFVWVLDDWRLDGRNEIDPNFVTRHDLAHDGRWGAVVTVNALQRPHFDVAPGERVRIRLVNVANGRVFAPDFSGLDAKVVAFDALPTARPLSTEGLVLASGNRADIELTVPSGPPGTSVSIVDRYSRRTFALADLRIADRVPAASPAPTVFSKVPRWTGAEAIEPDLVFRLDARRGGPFGIEWTINGEAMRHDGPMIDPHPPAPYRLRTGRFTKLRFVNESARLHPMHLHGNFFKVVARNGRAVDEEHWRDTVLVGARETVDVSIVPGDEGAWVLHCHILEHHDSGMMTVIAVN